jgi:copper chaperone CopZ
MRLLFTTLAAFSLVVLNVGAVRADKVTLKGTHLCCGQCINVAKATLTKVEGVSDVKIDGKEQVVSFTAKDDKVASAALKAMVAAGFYGTATKDDKDFPIETPEVKKGTVSDTVTIKDVHVCCGSCKSGVEKALKEKKVTVTYEGKGVMKSVIIMGKSLDAAEMIRLLQKAGYTGTVEK